MNNPKQDEYINFKLKLSWSKILLIPLEDDSILSQFKQVLKEDLALIEQGQLDEEISKYIIHSMLPQIFKIFSERKFTAKEIAVQGEINEI